jgi:uncharacterized protein
VPISAYTAAALTLLLLTLSANVSRLRLTHKVSFGDADIKELTMAVRAHGNTLEQSVLFVLLLYFVETHAQHDLRLVLALGAAFVFARILYCAALFKRILPVRQISHVLTLLLQGAAVVLIAVH